MACSRLAPIESAWRCAGVIPPQTPYISSLVIALFKQISMTGHVLQMAIAFLQAMVSASAYQSAPRASPLKSML